MIDNTAFAVQFDAVSSSSSDYGIFVDNDPAFFDHPGTFSVLGDGATLASGGTITGASIAGASITNVNSVGLRFIDFTTNTVGVLTDEVRSLTLVGDQIIGSTSFGLDVLDSPRVLIQQSVFDSNQGFNQVRIQATQALNPVVTPNLPAYNISIIDNIFTDSTNLANVGLGDMINIFNTSTANNSNLSLLVQNNGRTNAGGVVGITSNRLAGNAAISTTWNGPVLATYSGNNIRLSALGGQIGTRLITTRTSTANDVVYSGNVFNDGGGSLDTGLRFDFSGATNLSIINNFGVDANNVAVVDGFTMNGGLNALDTAIDLLFRSPGNAINISDNRINFSSFDGTGILFETISGPSTVNMDGNRIVMFDDGFLPNEQGILFQSVTGTIALSSTRNNVVLPQGLITTRPLTIPAGVSTGSLLINGARVP
jgi:hypothetical protein